MPNIIGDFLWAGWDYLGEAGLGHWVHGKRIAPLMKSYPYLTSGSGVIDITGWPTAGALLAQAVWRTADAPGIAVRPLDVSAGPVAKAPWRASDAITSWSWAGREGQQAEVEVYSSAPEVELKLNGRSLDKRKAGRKHGFVAKFRVPYGPGELVAVARDSDGTIATSALISATGRLQLRLRVDEGEPTQLAADGNDLAYLWVEVTDADGVVESLADDLITLNIEGPAELAGFGSGAPATEESFADLHHRTYYGRALVVLRTTRNAGRVQVTATSPRHGSTTYQLDISPPAFR